MSLVINNNLMAANTARNLNIHYGKLQTSTQRLSSGLRINGAADDAAGLAIRELMRADVAALNQGVRNANDAISMIQVADGALAVIDEKLIRMKELAEQAATGTYNSIQRLMIDSEFQAMGSEINRIANATDFNGIKLINKVEDKLKSYSTTRSYIVNIDSRTLATPHRIVDKKGFIQVSEDINVEYITKNDGIYKKTIKNTIKENNIEETIFREMQLVAFANTGVNCNVQGGEILNPDIFDIIAHYGNTMVNLHDFTVLNVKYELTQNPPINFPNAVNFYDVYVDINGDNIADFRSYAYSANLVDLNRLYHPSIVQIEYMKEGPTLDTSVEHQTDEIIEKVNLEDLIDKVKIHFGPMNDSAEDYYYIEKRDCTLKGLGIDDLSIETQDKAQNALASIDDAIVKKDQNRAYYGAMQNRLENTITNLSIQAENLQASESRISDVDVATEMTNFVRNQILTQSAIAMLSQANLLPQMAMRLIGG